MSKQYDIWLNGVRFGSTGLGKADVPMSIVSGSIQLINEHHDCNYIRDYCLENTIGFNYYQDEKSISTLNIPNLQVFTTEGVEIKGDSATIEGTEISGFEISIWGIPSEIYENEFPYHIKNYQETLSDSDKRKDARE